LPGGEETKLPLYPYRCKECGHRFEKIQKFGAKPEKVCPKCGGALERTLTAPGLNFKGAGWYVNDYAPKSSKSSSKSAPAEKKAGGEARTESKTESKTASGGESGASSSTTSAPATASDTAAK
jgi:putative FmdB family regulatory protein